MITEFRHAGIVVSNLDSAIHFYHNLLGFQISKRMDESGEYINKVLDLDNVNVTTVKMIMNGHTIELLHYQSPQEESKITKRICSQGITHIAFTVDDIVKEYQRLSEAGVTFNSAPENSPDGYAKVVFCKDPDGNFIELVEVLK